MYPIKGLHFILAAAILQLQACNAGVMRNIEGTTLRAQIDTRAQVSTLADSTIPQDILGQTTLPPILFRTSTDTDTTTGSAIRTERSTSYETAQDIQPQLPRKLLPRTESQLGRKSTLANTSEMGSNATLVPTTELVPISTGVPKVGGKTVDTLVKPLPEKHDTRAFNTSVSKVLGKDQTEKLDTLSLLSGVQHAPSSSYISRTVQLLAHVKDALWEIEHKDEIDDESYKLSNEANDTEHEGSEEDDDLGKPVFQFNVPIVNEESVPMRVLMDIIPEGFPEDLEGPTFYPDYFDDKSTDLYPTAGNSLGGKDSDNPKGKYVALKGLDFGEASDETSDEGGHLNIRENIRNNKCSGTFERIVDLHRNLAAFVKNHGNKEFKRLSKGETEVLLKTPHNAAEQLRNIIPMILEEIDNEAVKDNLKTFLRSVSQSNSECFSVLSSLPPLRFT